MRRAAICLAILTFATLHPARAEHTSPEGAPFEHRVEHAFVAPIPCTFACPYWDPRPDVDPCAPEPLAAPGSYDDWDFTLEPPEDAGSEGIALLIYEIRSLVDADSFMCAHEPVNGDYVLAPGGHHIWRCNGATVENPWIGIGCDESEQLVVCLDITMPPPENFKWACLPRGMPVTLRVYNWLEPGPTIPGMACWSRTGIRHENPSCGVQL